MVAALCDRSHASEEISLSDSSLSATCIGQELPTKLSPSAGGVPTSYLHWAGATNPTTSISRRSPYQLPALCRSYQPHYLHQQEESLPATCIEQGLPNQLPTGGMTEEPLGKQ